jgi:exonuclease SbcC
MPNLISLVLDRFFRTTMFDFFFKRSFGKSPPVQVPKENGEPLLSPDAKPVRELALGQAEALAGNEASAVEFILQCPHADARFRAAHHVYARESLERVAQAMRNTDRRVARLAQKRLDAILLQEKTGRQADECIKAAQRLLDEPSLMANQVADLDRTWEALANIAPPAQESFGSVRAALGGRLEAQAALQRTVMNLRTKLQKLERAATEAPHVFTPERLAQSLDSLEQEMAQYRADREAPSLPSHLLSEFTKQRDHCREILASMEQRNEAMAAREAALADWEAAPVAELKEDALRRAWRALPPLSGDDGAMEARFNALLVRIGDLRKPKESASVDGKADQLPHFTEALDSMEKALENGALHDAAELDRVLRAIGSNGSAPFRAQAARLAKARSELHRLQDWARWGGNISREELLKAAEELPTRSHPVPELAKKVGSLRERWKSLDSSAGPASREAWERFDAACSAAYAPVAAHFKKLAEERQHNLERARSIIIDIKEFAEKSNCAGDNPDEVDWKAVAGFEARTIQAWQRLGPIDRKEKKSADADFANAMRLLSEPLAAQRKIESARREKIIAEAGELNPNDRRALDTLRALQERWQEHAKSLPLERRDEQALWQRFRSACDAVFARRKEAAHAADAERQSHLREKEALCAKLESLEKESPELISKKMREAAEAWRRIGPVPRAVEHRIEQRYQSALEALRQCVSDAQRSAKKAQAAALCGKLKLCYALEGMIANRRAPDDSELMRAQTEWQALPALAPLWEQALQARFDKAVAAFKTADPMHAALLQQNRAVLAHDVLLLEIILGLDNPSESSRERLQLQVEVLQSSLKAGQKPLSAEQHLLRLCALPALTDQQLAGRIERMVVGIDGVLGA